MPTTKAKRLLQERITRAIAGERPDGSLVPRPMPRHQQICGCCHGWHRVRPKRLCVVCRRLDNNGLPCCRANSIQLPYHIRVPRRTASSKQWQQFLRRFAPAYA